MKLLSVLTNDESEPHVHVAALMITSFALQRLLKEGGATEEQMTHMRERALEIAENMRIELHIKVEEPK